MISGQALDLRISGIEISFWSTARQIQSSLSKVNFPNCREWIYPNSLCNDAISASFYQMLQSTWTPNP